MNRYHLLKHCFGIKKYIMLSAGDFIQHLMDIISPELEKHADRIFAHNMMGFIQHAARASNAQYDDEDTLSRLSAHVLTARSVILYFVFNVEFQRAVRITLIKLRFVCDITQKSHGETGWDVFSLDYRVDLPISVVLHNDAMRKGYYRMFHFLWRLKRVDHLLGRAWQAHLSDHMHKLDRVSKFKGVLSLTVFCSSCPPE